MTFRVEYLYVRQYLVGDGLIGVKYVNVVNFNDSAQNFYFVRPSAI